jgi:hypothetical protein
VPLDAFAKGIHMQAKYTRLFVDEHGGSRFEDLATELQPGFCSPGMVTPGISAPFLITDVGSFWIGAPSVWKDDKPHTAPRRMILVTTQGEYEVTTSNGMVRRFPIGNVVVVEDTSGAGHSFKIIGTEDVMIFGVGLPSA